MFYTQVCLYKWYKHVERINRNKKKNIHRYICVYSLNTYLIYLCQYNHHSISNEQNNVCFQIMVDRVNIILITQTNNYISTNVQRRSKIVKIFAQN